MTLCAVLPRSIPARSPLPLEPITISPTSCSLAFPTITWAACPYIERPSSPCALTPAPVSSVTAASTVALASSLDSRSMTPTRGRTSYSCTCRTHTSPPESVARSLAPVRTRSANSEWSTATSSLSYIIFSFPAGERLCSPQHHHFASVPRHGMVKGPPSHPDVRAYGAACEMPFAADTEDGRHQEASRTTTTGHGAWCTQCMLTEPSSAPAKPPCPRLPTTSRSASAAASIRTCAG